MKLKKKKNTDHNHDIYITTPEFNKLTSENFVATLKQANLAGKSDIANFVNKTDFHNKLSGFNKRINSNKTKHALLETELNELSNKVKAISTKDYNFLLGRIGRINFTSNDGLQNRFLYQTTSSTIKLQGNNTVSSWKSQRVYVTDLVPIKNDFLAKIKYFKDGIGMQFSYTYLVSVQISYTTNIVNVYIVCDLDNWPRNPQRKIYTKKLFV